MDFIAYELTIRTPHERIQLLQELRSQAAAPLLILNTCQRLECYGPALTHPDQFGVTRVWEREDAFARLARIAAGLESRILGELEILGQVRQAYKDFQQAGGSDHAKLDRMFQDVLALAREARRRSGIDQNLTSLGALASRALMEQVEPGAPVAVIGAGSLAASVARYLNKRGDHPIRVSSRCPENALALAQKVNGFASGLDGLVDALRDVRGIVTATAAPHAVLYPDHLKHVPRPLIVIDLGVPPDCDPGVAALPDLTYVPLEQIESRAQLNSEERRQKAIEAERIIREGAQAWARKHAA